MVVICLCFVSLFIRLSLQNGVMFQELFNLRSNYVILFGTA